MPTAEVNGVQVDSHTGTTEELAAQLTPESSEPAKGTVVPTTEKPVEATPAEAKPDHDPASDAGRVLAHERTKKELRAEFEERIAKATYDKHEERRQREKAEAELNALKHPTAAKTADPSRPTLKSFVDRIGTDFDDYESAIDAHADALTDYKLAVRDQVSNSAQFSRARDEALHKTHAQGLAAHADFDAVLGQFVSEGGRLSPSTPAEAQGPLGDLESVILQHPLGHTVAYEVAKDAELRARLLTAPSRPMFMAEMGKLLTRLDAAPAGSASTAAPVSKAHAPVKPVASTPTATDGPPGDDATDEDYRVWANARDLARRRRA